MICRPTWLPTERIALFPNDRKLPCHALELRRCTARIPVPRKRIGLLLTSISHPSMQRCGIHPQIPSHLRHRTTLPDHQIHRVQFELPVILPSNPFPVHVDTSIKKLLRYLGVYKNDSLPHAGKSRRPSSYSDARCGAVHVQHIFSGHCAPRGLTLATEYSTFTSE